MTCSFDKENVTQFLNVEIIAKNKTNDILEEKHIAVFTSGNAARLHTSGQYLVGRVTLTNITKTSTKATLTFHILKCKDEMDYFCKFNSFDMDSAVVTEKSESTRIIVKGIDFFKYFIV